jgi:tetratricopeptide (TPR) repeat protein
MRAYERHAARYPDRAAPIRAIGGLYLQEGSFTTAAEQFEKALLIDPTDFQSLVAMADISERTAEFDRARAYYDRAISGSRGTDQMWVVGGRLVAFFDLQGMTDSAIARVEALYGYLRSSQGRLAELQHRANTIALYARAGRTGQARALLDTLRAELEPPMTQFVPIAEALLLRELGQGDRLEAKIPEARRLYEELGYEALDWMMLYLDAEARRLQDRCADAIPLFEQAATGMQAGLLGETDVSLGGNPWLGLGTCYRETGRHGDAVNALGQSYSRIPADARVLLQLALLYRDMGDRTEALRYLNGAVHVWRNADPDHVLANEAKALLASWEGRG